MVLVFLLWDGDHVKILQFCIYTVFLFGHINFSTFSFINFLVIIISQI